MATTTQVRATFQVKTWDEETTSEVDGHLKITHAKVAFAYDGDLQGESAMQYLMLYRDDGSASVIGLERIVGQLAGKSGSFVLQHMGGYADGVASGEFEVVKGSGSGQLAGMRGRGTAVSRKDGTTELTLEYEFAPQ
jgi:hypothetical protein